MSEKKQNTIKAFDNKLVIEKEIMDGIHNMLKYQNYNLKLLFLKIVKPQ